MHVTTPTIEARQSITKFTQSAIESLKYYVYGLIDPRDNKIFYIGKGNGNRVFDHVIQAIMEPNFNSLKYDIIREIESFRLNVQHIIIRHGIDEKTALEIEASLIDVLSLHSLTNIILGNRSKIYGLQKHTDIEALYSAQELRTAEKLLLININRQFRRNMSESDLYEATRYAWVIGDRRDQAKYVLPTYRNITRAVYEVDNWYTVLTNGKKRWAFNKKDRLTKPAEAEKLVNMSVSDYFRRGASNPIRYINC